MPKRARTDPRKKPMQTRSVATVDAILQAGARVLAREGYEGAGVNRIAQLAGVSIGSLYQYFPSKEALVAAVVRRHSDGMIATFQEGLTDLAHVPLREAIGGVVRRTFAAYALDPALRRVIVNEVPQLELLTRSHEFDEVVRGLITGFLVFHASEVRPENLNLAVLILMTAVEAVAVAVLVKEPHLLASEELVSEVTQLVFGYVAKGPVTPPPPAFPPRE
jgi:AcrR family transcriptional regulator